MLGLNAAQAARIARCPVVVLSANRFTSQLVRSLFFGLGMQDVSVAGDPSAARERFEVTGFDLVVADTGAATFDPFDTLQVLRGLADQRRAATPVILLAAPGADASDERLSGIHRLPKPLSNKEFSRTVLRVLLNVEDEHPERRETAPAGRRVTTLLLSGNPYTAQVVRALLLTMGLSDVAVAGTPADAERRLSDQQFDLVIADAGPASFDGLAMLETIRAVGGFAEKPVLLLASSPSQSLVERARAAKVRAIATKPLDPDGFAERVRKLIAAKAH